MFLHKLIPPLFEQDSYIMIVQMLVSIPLMRHRTERAIPIVHLGRLLVIKPPFRKRFGPQRTKIVNNPLALFPHDQFGNGIRIGQLAAVIQVVVKSWQKSTNFKQGSLLNQHTHKYGHLSYLDQLQSF